mgnify:CR=1 FL=1
MSVALRWVSLVLAVGVLATAVAVLTRTSDPSATRASGSPAEEAGSEIARGAANDRRGVTESGSDDVLRVAGTLSTTREELRADEEGTGGRGPEGASDSSAGVATGQVFPVTFSVDGQSEK